MQYIEQFRGTEDMIVRGWMIVALVVKMKWNSMTLLKIYDECKESKRGIGRIQIKSSDLFSDGRILLKIY